MTEEQDKQTAIGLLEREWRALDTWLRSLAERQLDAPVFGEGPGWRVRDMVTHLASVQEQAGRVAEKVAKEGGQPTTNWREFLGIEKTNDEMNAETFATWRERPMAERWDRWLQAHSRMMDAFRALRPDQLLQAEGGKEGMKLHFALLGLIHLRVHREHIEAALKETSSTRAAVVATADAQPREYLGVHFDLLAVGERAMVTRMRFQAGVNAPTHTHPHEQAGYVVSGRYQQTIAGTIHELHPGDSYAIPGGIEQAMEVVEDGQVIDVFTPPRDEFR